MTTYQKSVFPSAAVWKDSALVENFLGRVRRGMPLAEAQFDVMMRVIEGRGQPVNAFLDLGCGDGILASAILSEYPDATGVLVDFSMPMIQAAIANLKSYGKRIHFSTVDYADPNWFGTVAAHGPYDAIVSGFSIHHHSDRVKQQIYRDVFDLLGPGGVFVNMEHVRSASQWLEAVHDDFFIDSLWASQVGRADPSAGSGDVLSLSKGQRSESRAQVAAAYHSRDDKAANILAPVESQCHWLRQIGFQDVDCYFKAFELALFGGRKPPQKSIHDFD